MKIMYAKIRAEIEQEQLFIDGLSHIPSSLQK